jgi:hypothetical protein
MNAGSLFAVAFLVLSPGTQHSVAADAAASPSPAVSFATTNPVLIQNSPLVWTTTVLLDESPSCLGGLTYQLVTRSPDYLVNGSVQGTARTMDSPMALCSAELTVHRMPPHFVAAGSLA